MQVKRRNWLEDSHVIVAARDTRWKCNARSATNTGKCMLDVDLPGKDPLIGAVKFK